MKIYVSNLAFDISEEEVRRAFEAFGEVAGIELAKNSETGVLKGFGFIEMPNRFEAKAAITHLNDQKLKGRTLTVIEAQTAVDEPVQKAPEDSFKTQEKFSSAKNRDRKNPAPSHAASGKYSSTRNGYRPGQPVYAEDGASRRPNGYRSQTTRSAEGFRKPNPRPGGYPARPEGGYRSSAPRPGGGYPAKPGRPDGGYRSSAPRPGGGYPAKPGRPDGGYRSSAPRPGGGYPAKPGRPEGGYRDRAPRAEGYRSSNARPGAYRANAPKPGSGYRPHDSRPSSGFARQSGRPASSYRPANAHTPGKRPSTRPSR